MESLQQDQLFQRQTIRNITSATVCDHGPRRAGSEPRRSPMWTRLSGTWWTPSVGLVTKGFEEWRATKRKNQRSMVQDCFVLI